MMAHSLRDRKARQIGALLIFLLAMTVLACGSDDLSLQSQQQFDFDLIQQLEDQGISTSNIAVFKPEQCLSSSPTKSYGLSTGGRIHLYAFDSESAAEIGAELMPSPAVCSSVDWLVDVRYFLCSALIVFSTTEDESVLAILSDQCGQPFEQVAARSG